MRNTFARCSGVLLSALTGLGFLAGPAALGQQGFDGLNSGVVYHAPSRSLRTVTGIPGSWLLGAPLAEDVDAGFASPDGRHAVVIREGAPRLIRLRPGTEALEVSGLMAEAGQAVWSPDSSEAVLWSASGRSFQRVYSAADRARADAPVPLPGDGAVQLIGASRNSGIVFFWGETDAEGIYLWPKDAAPQRILPAAGASAVALAPDSGALYFMDESRRSLMKIQPLAPGTAPLAVSELRLEGRPKALAADGSAVYLLAENPARVVRYDLSAGTETEPVELSFQPSGLRFFQNCCLLLNSPERNDEPLQILHTGTGSPMQTLFIPGIGQ